MGNLWWQHVDGTQGNGEQGLEQTFYCIPFYIFTYELCGCVSYFKNTFWNFPSWSSGWESTCQRREHKCNPWSGKIPNTMGKLRLCAATTEAFEPQGSASTREVTAMRSLHTTTE